MGIVWNGKKFESDGRDAFDKSSYVKVLEFQQRISSSWLLKNYTSPKDREVAKSGKSGKNLDHHIPISAIEDMVVYYLNGEVSVWQFLEFVGHVVTPSWLSLADALSTDPRRWTVLHEYFAATWQKFSIAWNRSVKSPKEVARMATDLVTVLNNAQQNLRFGDGSTNKSISDALDIRQAHGFRFDPAGLIETVFARGLGFVGVRWNMLAPESCSLINSNYAHLGARIQPVTRGTDWASSESDQQVSTTKTKSKSKIYGIPDATVSVLRGSIIPGIPYSPVDRSTFLYLLFGLYVLYAYLLAPR